MIFFGANDACLTGNAQHVPLDEYSEALKTLCQHPSVVAHSPKIMLITPPPVNEYQFPMVNAHGDNFAVMRTAQNTRHYAQACTQVASDLKLPVVDLWNDFMCHVGWRGEEPLPGSRQAPPNELLNTLFVDGQPSINVLSPCLHLSSTLTDKP